MRHRIICILFLSATALLITECSKDRAAVPTETDQKIFAKANASGFTYYKNDSTIHRASPPSGHFGFFRVRFNAVAIAALTDNGKLPVNGTMPTGSLIVKELYNDSASRDIHAYAIMEKLPSDTNAAAGWVWAEYNAAGSGYGVGNKGATCTGCHSTDDRDLLRLFDLFP